MSFLQNVEKGIVNENLIYAAVIIAGILIWLLVTLRRADSFRKSYLAAQSSQKEAEEARQLFKTRTKELQEMAAGLEEKVKERTKELQEKIDEMERFQKLTVGREIKMAELKKEIKRLKGQK